jgi:hypothetical protein
MKKVVGAILCALLGGTCFVEDVSAAELRIVDTAGLIRAVRVVRDTSTVTVVVEEPKGAKGECVLANVDGIASERREAISASGACVFQGLAAGTWQAKVVGGTKWRVKINE